ncbi:MAG: restriction endonuclease subunit S [Pseudomonadota bacterium]
MRIDEICEIQSGYTARGRLSPSPLGVPALQLRDLTDRERWDEIEPECFQLGQMKERYFAGPGDVLFRSRGATNTASAIPADWAHLAVAILPLILLKPDVSRIRPAFLAWSINQPFAQLHFDRRARGTSMRMVPRGVLAELEIDLPDLKTQDMILETSRLSEEAYALEQKSAALRLSLSRLQLSAAAKLHQITTPKGADA